ncbi:hypothetical protein [Actinomadura verrucosospora]|uniref:Heavy metal translocating P-type ATPase n=1 Tax=Actinomadura verrucosospora TaxID=46165 RepID=A0A7D3ZHR2_ACTVE|nr:hypothetical protein [Actinomadura verrucosospora]QKG24057.1 heavy metal translocating P-type ATPase [Actinomadura verrucosospora]
MKIPSPLRSAVLTAAGLAMAAGLAAFAPAASASAAETAAAVQSHPRHCPWGTHWDMRWHRCVRDRDDHGHGDHGGWHHGHGDWHHGHGHWHHGHRW